MIKIASSDVAKSSYSGGSTGIAIREMPFSMIIGNNVVEKDTLALVPFETQHYNCLGNYTSDNAGVAYPLFVLDEVDTGWALGIYQYGGSAYLSFIPTSLFSSFSTKRFNDDGTQVFEVWGKGQRRVAINSVTIYNPEALEYLIGAYNPFFSELKPIMLRNFPQSSYPTTSYRNYGFFVPLGVFKVDNSYKHILLRVSNTQQNSYPALCIWIATEDGTSVSYSMDVYKTNSWISGAVPIYYDDVNKIFHLLYPNDSNSVILTVNLNNNSCGSKSISLAAKRAFLPALTPSNVNDIYYVSYVDNDSGSLKLSKIVYDSVNIAITETVVDSSLPEVESARLSKSTTPVRLEKVSANNKTYYLLFLESRFAGGRDTLNPQNSNGDDLAKIWIYEESNGTLNKVGEINLPSMIRCIAFSKDRQTAVFGCSSGTFLLVADANSSVGFSIKTLSSVIPVAVGRDEYDRFWIMDVMGDIYLYSPVLPFEVDARLELPTHYIKEGQTIQGTLYLKVVNGKGQLMQANVRLVSRNPDVALLGSENKQVLDVTTSTDSEIQVPITVYRRGKIIIDKYLLSVNLGG